MKITALNPFQIFLDIWRHRYLLGQLVKRDVLLRYRGAMLGVLWIFLSPLLMLSIFAFIFGQVFHARWPQEHGALPFWLVLYSGLITFNIFAETVARAPMSVRGNPNFVKKIVFPVHILPMVPLGVALVHGTFNFLLMLAALAGTGTLTLQALTFPLLLLPVLFLALGLSWFVAAWGVFIKDITQVVPMLTQMLLFLSPVFYPVSAVPAFLQPFYRFNALGIVIETSRAVIVGQPVLWSAWGLAFVACFGVLLLGYAFFQYSRGEFADVL
ncbi:MAG TPA: ABC transporter permease [Polaromonas sp.]|uniref:ABC transporter permease n=1 Tax=Polaromonas sp. TaxID=1869339 RepID=UPI002D349691|nr:ABC transporter permease [Polaromonas sp.]HYW56937.1 ABC transporter permease [Polaromonas sp.]